MRDRTATVGGHSCPLVVTASCGVLLQPVQGSLWQGIFLHLTMVHRLPEQVARDLLSDLGVGSDA